MYDHDALQVATPNTRRDVRAASLDEAGIPLGHTRAFTSGMLLLGTAHRRSTGYAERQT